jgi:hypothetical protein
MVIFFWILNFVISIFNAWSCGKTWYATKQKGGLAHFMNWMGAIMSASGFTWCYTLALAAVGSLVSTTDTVNGVEVTGPLVSPDMLQAIIQLGYMVIILPILGSGLAITVASWRYAARSRSFGDTAIAGWNTYAQISNTVSAVQNVPNVLGGLIKFFSKGDDKKNAIVLILVTVAALGGIMTTFGIIRMTAAGTLEDENARAEQLKWKAAKMGSVGASVPVGVPVGTKRS